MVNYMFVCAFIALGGLVRYATQTPVKLHRHVRQSGDDINLEDKYGDPFGRPQRPQRPQRPLWQGGPPRRPDFGNQQSNGPGSLNNIQFGNSQVDQSNSSAPAAPPTAQSTQAPTPEPSCIIACLVTPQYNPVCGSNNVTYQNEGRLGCASKCGIDVTLLRYGNCDQPAART